MQGAQRKISKKELKEDQLITYYYKSKDFIEKNGKIVSGAIIGLIVVVILVGMMIKSRAQSNLTASGELFQAQLSYNMQDYQGTAAKLNTIVETYSGTQNAREAMILLARTYFKMENFDSSFYFADRFVKKYSGDPVLTSSAISLKAASLEEKEEFLEAAETYLSGADRYSKSFTAPTFLLDAGRCFYLVGNMERAQQCYERIIAEYPESNLVLRANQQLVRAGGADKDVTKGMKFL